MTAIKFCGITQPMDAKMAAELGARYVGAILTNSPRRVSPSQARAIYSAAGTAVSGVAVFRQESVRDVARAAGEAGAAVIQVHQRLSANDIDELRSSFTGEIWQVVGAVPGDEAKISTTDGVLGDGVVVDAVVAGRSGGTGAPLDWKALTPFVVSIRVDHRLILAGGLNASNVGAAIATLDPDVVDVSSGVEALPGIKDHHLMKRFADAVKSAGGVR